MVGGQVYLYTAGTLEVPPNSKELDNVLNIGVAGPFLVFTFADGTTVMEKAEGFDRVQFTPYETADTEDVGQGENDTSG